MRLTSVATTPASKALLSRQPSAQTAHQQHGEMMAKLASVSKREAQGNGTFVLINHFHSQNLDRALRFTLTPLSTCINALQRL